VRERQAVTVIAVMLGLIFCAILWPRGVRWVFGAVAWLLWIALLVGLTTWGFMEWGDQPLKDALVFASLIWGAGIVWSIWEHKFAPFYLVNKWKREEPETYEMYMSDLREENPDLYREFRNMEGRWI
jgi:hypothetical protein